MKIKNSFTFGLGLFLAPFISLTFIIIFSPSSPSENRVTTYIKNSTEITLDLNKVIPLKSNEWAGHLVKGDKQSFFKIVRYYLKFRKNRNKEYSVFYSSHYKKYFVAESYNSRFNKSFQLRL